MLNMPEYVAPFIADARGWCKGKNWLVRLPAAVWFVYVLARHLSDPLYSSILGPLNLGIHELGHVIFSFAGEAMSVAGGTVFQLFVPVFAVYNFLKQSEYFGAALSFGWLSTNLFSIAAYIADARALSLPLVTPFGGDSVVHDWEYMLDRMGLLPYDQIIAGSVRVLAVASMLVCLAACGWLFLQMARFPGRQDGNV